MDNKTVSITIYGETKKSDLKWKDWYEDAKKIIKLLGYEYNYVGIRTQKFTSGKVMEVRKNENEVFNEILIGKDIRYISMYSLPQEFQSACFDYDVMIMRNHQFITLTVNKCDFNKIDEQKLLECSKKYIDNIYVEVYEMDRDEVPLLYASKINPVSFFKSLKIIKIISY